MTDPERAEVLASLPELVEAGNALEFARRIPGAPGRIECERESLRRELEEQKKRAEEAQWHRAKAEHEKQAADDAYRGVYAAKERAQTSLASIRAAAQAVVVTAQSSDGEWLEDINGDAYVPVSTLESLADVLAQPLPVLPETESAE